MANIAVQVVTPAGIVPTFAACAGGGDTIVGAQDGDVVWLESTHSSDQTATFEATVAVAEGYTELDKAQIAAAATDRRCFKLTRQYIADDGTVAVTYSGVTGLTIGVFRA